MTRVGAELPQPQTQSGLKAHSLSPAIRPASVASRCAPRGSSSRRQKAGPPGESGATQESHSTPAQDTEAVDRAPLLALPPTKPGPEARVHLLCPNGPITVALGDGLPPIRARMDDHVPIRARPGKLFPARPHAGRGEDGHVPAGPRPGRDPPRVPMRAAGSQGVTRPQLDAAGSRPERLRGPRGPGGKRPPSRRGRRDRRGHGARCKAVPARGAGCGPRADSEGGAGPPGRPDNAIPST